MNNLKEIETLDLQSELMVVRSKAEAIRYKNQDHGNTPEFWGLVAKAVKLSQGLVRRKVERI